MGTKWRWIKAACAAVIGFLFPRILVAAGVPLEEWAQLIGSRIGGTAAMISAGTAINIVGFVLAFILMFAELWWQPVGKLISSVRSSKRERSHDARSSAATSKRMPLIALYHEANRRGWDFGGTTGHVFDFANGLKQAGADGDIVFSGTRVHRVPALTEDGFLEEIPKDFWRACSISAISPFKIDSRTGCIAGIQDQNKNTESYNPVSSFGRLTYCDMHVDRAQAMRWLKIEAKQHMGKHKAESAR